MSQELSSSFVEIEGTTKHNNITYTSQYPLDVELIF